MSTYTHRFYEVRVPVIDQYVQDKNTEIVPEKELYNGYTARVWFDYENPYRIWDSEKKTWKESKECRKKWVLAKWFTPAGYGYHPSRYDYELGKCNPHKNDDEREFYRTPISEEGIKLEENICYCDNGGIVRDEFISGRGWSDEEWEFEDRGFPDDMSEDLKKEFSKDMKYTWGHTYVVLSEWNDVYDKMLTKFKNALYEKFMAKQKGDIDEKLDTILKKIADPEYKIPKKKKKKTEEEEDYGDSDIKYLWEEDFIDVMTVHGEIGRAYDMIEYFGWMSDKDVRIIYYLS